MGGVGPLPPPSFEKAELTRGLEHPLQQALRRAAGQQAVSELAQHAEVKARVGQLQAEKVLPVDPGPHGFGDRKSTRLNSSHANISYAVFCLQKNYLLVEPLDVLQFSLSYLPDFPRHALISLAYPSVLQPLRSLVCPFLPSLSLLPSLS